MISSISNQKRWFLGSALVIAVGLVPTPTRHKLLKCYKSWRHTITMNFSVQWRRFLLEMSVIMLYVIKIRISLKIMSHLIRSSISPQHIMIWFGYTMLQVSVRTGLRNRPGLLRCREKLLLGARVSNHHQNHHHNRLLLLRHLPRQCGVCGVSGQRVDQQWVMSMTKYYRFFFWAGLFHRWCSIFLSLQTFCSDDLISHYLCNH